MNLENDLRRALRSESPEPGFASRVLARIEAEERELRAGEKPRPQRWWWRAAAASVMLTALAGAWTVHEIRERREGERARDQVLLAMRIAGEKVRVAQEEVRSIGSQD
jgi:hypothetical protein